MACRFYACLILLASRMLIAEAFWQDFSILSMNPMNDTDEDPVKTDLNFDQVSRKTFRIDGTIVTRDVCQYQIEAFIEFSSRINGKAMPTSTKASREAVPAFLAKHYEHFYVKNLAKSSDLPPAPATDDDVDAAAFCSKFENAEFRVTNFVYEPDNFPKSMHNGFYRIVVRLWNGNAIISGFETVFRLT